MEEIYISRNNVFTCFPKEIFLSLKEFLSPNDYSNKKDDRRKTRLEFGKGKISLVKS